MNKLETNVYHDSRIRRVWCIGHEVPNAIKRKALDAPHSAYALLVNVGFMVYKFNGVSFDWWCISANRWRKSRTCKIYIYGKAT